MPLTKDPMTDYEGFRLRRSLTEALDKVGDRSYLMLWRKEGLYVSTERREQGQFFRRQIARALGRAEEWDYVVFPNYDAMRETRDRLSDRSC
jgi:hypothetical protein